MSVGTHYFINKVRNKDLYIIQSFLRDNDFKNIFLNDLITFFCQIVYIRDSSTKRIYSGDIYISNARTI